MGNLKVTRCEIDGVYVIEPEVHGDERGYFVETYNKQDFEALGLTMEFVQDNQSKSKKGVLRGLHFQKQHPQGKLVRALEGEIYDVAVDIREGSPTYGKWFGTVLSESNMKQVYVPEGFAHGFFVLSDSAVFSYKCTDFYHPEDECGICWNDPEIGIEWPIAEGVEVILSEKDKNREGISALRR